MLRNKYIVPNMAGIDRYDPELQLYLPTKKMDIGISENLLVNPDFEDGTTGWVGTRSVISAVTNPVHSGSNALKEITSDVYPQAYQNLPNPTLYRGITVTFTGYGYCLSTNTQKPAKINVQDYNGSTYVSGSNESIVCDDAWHMGTASKKIRTDAITIRPQFANNDTGVADADDVCYWDSGVVTVPQAIEYSKYARKVHPEGCIWTPQGWYFDGIDDLVTSELDVIGTNDITFWGWVMATGAGGGSAGRIIDNGKFNVFRNSAGYLQFTSDGGLNYCNAAAGSSPLSKMLFIAGTRTAAGVGNIFMGDAFTPPTLSGSGDQNTGTPAAGTTNVVLFNRLAGDRGFMGYGPELYIETRIKTLPEMMRAWEATKGDKW